MSKILIATDKPFAKIAVDGIRDIIETSGFQFVLLEKYSDKKQLLEAAKDADAIIVRSDIIDKEVISSSSKLKLIIRAGAGYDNIDLNAATQKGICVMNTPGQNSNAVAELVMGLLIYKIRNFFDGTSGMELFGKKIGFFAYGNVSKNVKRIADGLGMEAYAYDPFVSKEDMKKEGVKYIDTLENLFSTCDIVSLHAPATEKTKKSINYDLLYKLPKNGIVVNTARKEIIDEQGLFKLMNDRQDVSYLTDIMPSNHSDMSKFEKRYFSTPKKMGAQTSEANINAGLAAANQAVGFFKNGDETFKVNK